MIARRNGMRQEQTGTSGKSISSGINYPAPARESDSEQRRTLGNMVFATDKLLLKRMLRAIGDPPVQLVLWNGQGISNHQGNPVARVLIRDRGALFKLVIDPELYFGELYSAQRIEAVSYTHLRAHETRHDLVCRLLL